MCLVPIGLPLLLIEVYRIPPDPHSLKRRSSVSTLRARFDELNNPPMKVGVQVQLDRVTKEQCGKEERNELPV